MTKQQEKLLENFIRREVRKSLIEEKSPRESLEYLLTNFADELIKINKNGFDATHMRNLIKKYLVYAEMHKII